jgi:hypothetical protein
MSQGASHYPIVQFISRLMQESGLSPTEFVHALGYKKIERGLLRLNRWLDNCDGHDFILKQIAAWSGQAEELQRAVEATELMKTSESKAAFLKYCKSQQESFRPYIHVEGETTRPTSITMFGMSGGRWNLIDIDQALEDMPLAERLSALPQLMRSYLHEHDGECPFFGKVTGFRYVRCLDYYQFDKDGKLVEHVDKPFRRGSAAVSLR